MPWEEHLFASRRFPINQFGFRMNSTIIQDDDDDGDDDLGEQPLDAEQRVREAVGRLRLTLPGGCPPSTISAKELNFCVRNGNRCILFAIITT